MTVRKDDVNLLTIMKLEAAAKYLFLFLVLLVVIISAPTLSDRYIPYHDTLLCFNLFYYFYNHLFFEGTLAQWMPHYAYGLPAAYWQIFALTPASYVAMGLGLLFRVTDVLWLFKISILIEHLFFVLGMFVLSRYLFKNISTIVLVCLGGACIHSVLGQVFFEVHVFYLFPFAAYFWLRFWNKKFPCFSGLPPLPCFCGASETPCTLCFCGYFFFA